MPLTPEEALAVFQDHIDTLNARIEARLSEAGIGVQSQSAIRVYDYTTANVENSATRTQILTSNIIEPLADKDSIAIDLMAKFKNNKGSVGTITLAIRYGNSIVTVMSQNIGDNAAEGFRSLRFLVTRRGETAYAAMASGEAAADSDFRQDYGDQFSSPSFNGQQQLQLLATLSAADADFYIKPLAASVVHTHSRL